MIEIHSHTPDGIQVGSMQIQPRRIFLFAGRAERAARALFEKYGFEKVADVDSLFCDDGGESLYLLRL